MRRAILILVVGFSHFASAQPPKPAAPTGEFAGGKKETDFSAPPTEPVEKPKAFTATADEINAGGFVTVAKDGQRVTNKTTPTTEILQGRQPAKISDLLPADVVTGTRRRITDTEYELVKITRFVHKPTKPAAKPK